MSLPTLLGSLLATILTLAIFSRAFRPNIAFRWAAHLVLGAGAGYVAAVVLKQVILPALMVVTFLNALQYAASIVAIILAGLLALRFSSNRGIRAWGLPPIGLMAGVGGALAMAGALRGSLMPQLMAVEQWTILPEHSFLNALVIFLATLTSLGVLLYLLPDRNEWNESETPRWLMQTLHGWQKWGYLALMLGTGALLASTAGARITLLIDRVQWLLGLWF